jgi:hypothetical protein
VCVGLKLVTATCGTLTVIFSVVSIIFCLIFCLFKHRGHTEILLYSMKTLEIYFETTSFEMTALNNGTNSFSISTTIKCQDPKIL